MIHEIAGQETDGRFRVSQKIRDIEIEQSLTSHHFHKKILLLHLVASPRSGLFDPAQTRHVTPISIGKLPLEVLKLVIPIGSARELNLADQLVELGRYLRFKSELLSEERVFE